MDRAWTSPAARARQTAEALGLAADVEPALRGCDHGRWTGCSLAEAQAADGEAALLAWLGDPAAAPHGGESFADVLAPPSRPGSTGAPWRRVTAWR